MVVEKEAETKKKMAISEAEKNANVSMILMEQKLMEKESARRQQEIDNHIYLAREKSLADANYYRYFSPFAFPSRHVHFSRWEYVMTLTSSHLFLSVY